jgi:hypothetical protein
MTIFVAKCELSTEIIDLKFNCHPVDKPKGLVKGKRMRRVAVSNSLAMSLETWRRREPSLGNHFQWKN